MHDTARAVLEGLMAAVAYDLLKALMARIRKNPRCQRYQPKHLR